MERKYRVLDVEFVDGDLIAVIDGNSIFPCSSSDKKYNPKYTISPEKLRKIEREYGVKWNGTQTGTEEIRSKIKGKSIEL